MRLIAILFLCLLCAGGSPAASGAELSVNLALGRAVTASSSPTLAKLLVDGEAPANSSWHTSWDPPQVPARPSWVMIDLGDARPIGRVTIAFSVAAYDGVYDVWAPPEGIIIEVGNHAQDLRPVWAVPRSLVPEHGACPEHRWLDVDLPGGAHGKIVRLVFPDGGKLRVMPNVVGLAEIRILSAARPNALHRMEVIEGQFGRMEVDVEAPQIVRLRLREPDEKLSSQSLLAEPPRALTLSESETGRRYYRQGAYTYITQKDGRRFESRRAKPERVSIDRQESGRIKRLRLEGIRLATDEGIAGPVVEDWSISAEGGSVVWTIYQRWIEDAQIGLSGTPAIYLGSFGGPGALRDRRVAPKDAQLTSTIWYAPEHILSDAHPDYDSNPFTAATANRTYAVAKRDTWAIYKLFTNFHLASDIHASVQGGFLYRRAGGRNDFNEIGATLEQTLAFDLKAGEVRSVSLVISPSDKRKTGQQLAVDLPDPVLERRLRDLHGSVLNGGIVSDQKRFHFGNGSDDVNYAGSSNIQARALSVSIQAGATAEMPHDADRAFRGHLEQVLATVDENGLSHFGFNAAGAFLDDNLHVISAVRHYVIKRGDRAFAERAMPTLARMAGYFTQRLDRPTGLFKSPEAGAHWYYDGIMFSGFNAYYQAFLYQALQDLSELLELVGKPQEAATQREYAKSLRDAINNHLWFADAPGGARYADWIDEKGVPAFHFIDIAQYALIAFGVAPEDRALAVLATADRRLSELKRTYGHTRQATLSMLWPLSASRPDQCFGTYFYGGSVLASTYWEVLARARLKHVDGEWGALRLLQNFAGRFEEMSFVGSNSIDIRGRVSMGGDEGYLADMVVVPAAVVHGLLGISTDRNAITAAPALPKEWPGAKVALMWMGELYDISVSREKLEITKRP